MPESIPSGWFRQSLPKKERTRHQNLWLQAIKCDLRFREKEEHFLKYGCFGRCLRLPPARGMHTATGSRSLTYRLILFLSRIQSSLLFLLTSFYLGLWVRSSEINGQNKWLIRAECVSKQAGAAPMIRVYNILILLISYR
jgi:hypothetical protein